MRFPGSACIAVVALLHAAPLPAPGQQRSSLAVAAESEAVIVSVCQSPPMDPVVLVQDGDGPVAGAEVTFIVPSTGASGTFANGNFRLYTKTDSAGRAVAVGLRANKVTGEYRAQVAAVHGGRRAATTLRLINVKPQGKSSCGGGCGRGCKAAIFLLFAGAGGGGGYLYYQNKIKQNPGMVSAPPPVSVPIRIGITPGSPAFGTPVP